MRILVTPRSLTENPHPAVERLTSLGVELVYCSRGRQPDEAELQTLIPGISGWLAGVEPVSPAVIADARHLKCISRNGTGIDNLPLEVLQARGIEVLTAGGANARGVAELTLTFLLSALRHVPVTSAGVKSGGWPRLIGREIKGLKLGLVGFGAVGREVALMASALGSSVSVYDPFLKPGSAGQVLQCTTLEQLLSSSDAISLHCPLPADGAPLIGRHALGLIRPGTILINTARSGLVDEQAVLEGLRSKTFAQYCTDVFEQEPPAATPLLAEPNVIATSHIGGYTKESVQRATEMAVSNLVACLGLGNHLQ